MKLKELEDSLNEKLRKSELDLENYQNMLKERKEKERKEKERKEKEKKEKEKKEKEKKEIKNKTEDEEKKEEIKKEKEIPSNEFSIFGSINQLDIDRNSNFIKDIPPNLPVQRTTINIKAKKEFKDKYYSYTLDNDHDVNLSSEVYEKIENTIIVLWLKNDGTLDWPENRTQLIFNIEKSECSGNNIILKPQRVNEVENYEVIFNGLSPLGEGEYKSYLNFTIDGNKIGEELKLTLIIKKKEDPYKDIEKYRDKINILRNEYNLNENDYSDKVLFDVLKKKDFNTEEAFMEIIN